MIDMRQYTTNLPCKVVLLGDNGVGKSSIISRFVHSEFILNNPATVGHCFTSKTVQYNKFKKSIQYELWDTAGQEKYRSMSRIFYQGSDVVFLVFDITNKESFESIEEYWYSEIKENISDSLAIVLIGNKSDLYEYEKVTTAEAKGVAERIGATYYSVSARTANGIDMLFSELGEKLLKRANAYEPASSPLERSVAKAKSNMSVSLNSSLHSRHKGKKSGSCCTSR